ncbi:hypothetical protein IG631_23716 [Alternaria alternata]|nr:hypothetical protein IG631_23716 [Alternaria alternata]
MESPVQSWTCRSELCYQSSSCLSLSSCLAQMVSKREHEVIHCLRLPVVVVEDYLLCLCVVYPRLIPGCVVMRAEKQSALDGNQINLNLL